MHLLYCLKKRKNNNPNEKGLKEWDSNNDEAKIRNNSNGLIYIKALFLTIQVIIYRLPALVNNAWNRSLPSRMYKTEYSDLTPNKNAEHTKEYFRTLDLAMCNPNIRNIALTGPYGAGKSSVIYSYLDKRPAINSLNISLSTFAETTIEKKKQVDGELNPNIKQAVTSETSKDNDIFNRNSDEKIINFDEDQLEKAILKQLFYKVNYRRIPLSRYRKIHRPNKFRVFIGVLLFFAIIAVSSWLLDYVTVESFYTRAQTKLMSSGVNKMGSNLILISLVLFIIYFASYMIGKVSSKMHLNALKVSQKVEFSLKEEEKENVFNKNLDEIIYFFESTKYDTVFIEDLDRFKSNEIFIRLRELNAILNSYELIKRRIVFIYSVRDDIFINTDRTKFFDFIIPIIPFINSTNSGEVMRKILELDISESEKICPKHDISDRFITLVSPYISDMRLLTCIMNEFWVYKSTIKRNQNLPTLRDENMFALMIFKNMYPQDFANLEAEKGIVKQAFEEKAKFIKILKDKIEVDIQNNEKILEGIDVDILTKTSELKISFLSYLTGFTGITTSIYANGCFHKLSAIMMEGFDFKILNMPNVYVQAVSDGANNTYRDAETYRNDSTIQKYFLRYDILINNEENRKTDIKNDIEKLRDSLQPISEKSIEEIINSYPAEEIFSKDVLKNKLLVFLLRHGYINEHYKNCINYFHPSSITTEEMNFVLGIRDHHAVGDCSYKLEHCDKIISRLEDFEFEQREILNFDLVDYILNNQNLNKQKFSRLFRQITNREISSKTFIKAYLQRGKNNDKFIKRICHESCSIWFDLENDIDLVEATKEQYFKLILSVCDIEDIIKNNDLDGSELVKHFFENDKNILLKMQDIPVEKLSKIIDKVDIHFIEINISKVNSDILEFIFSHNYYQLNFEMLKSLFQFKAPSRIENLFKANWSEILMLDYKPLIQNIENQFEKYVCDFVIKKDSNREETIDAIDDLIYKLVNTNFDYCISVIRKQTYAHWENIEDCLKECDSDNKKFVWECLLDNNKIHIKWDNFIAFYEKYGFTEVLYRCIETNIQTIVEAESVRNPSDDLIKKLLVTINTPESFLLLIQNYKVKEFDLPLSNLNCEKVELLVREGYFEFSIAKYLELKDLSIELSVEFAINNEPDFISNIAECNLDYKDVLVLLTRNEFNDDEHIKILQCITPQEINPDIANVIKDYKFLLPVEYVEAAWDSMQDVNKYELLYNQLENYSLDGIAIKFSELGGVYEQFAKRDKKHKYTLAASEYNKKLCDRLVDMGFLSSCNKENHNWLVGYVRQK